MIADYLLAEHFAAKLGLSEEELPSFQQRGIIHPVGKNGFVYYSSRDFFLLKAILHDMRNKGLSFEQARSRVMKTSHQAAAGRRQGRMLTPDQLSAALDRFGGNPFLLCEALARRVGQLTRSQKAGTFSDLINLALSEFLEGKVTYSLSDNSPSLDSATGLPAEPVEQQTAGTTREPAEQDMELASSRQGPDDSPVWTGGAAK